MTISVHADIREPGVMLHHFWSEVVGAGRAAEALRFDWQEQLTLVQGEIGFRYVRFHGLFHDDMFVYREVEGEVRPYFQYVDTVFDRLLEQGIRPFVELGFAPGALAREKATVFWWGAHGSPPTDLRKWHELVRLTVEHWVARYGLDEVLTWYFEVWNEPNLGPFFRGTKAEYFELYRASAHAVKGVDPRLRVGGPATSNYVPDARFDGETEDTSQHVETRRAEDLDSLDWRPVWLDEFFAFCAREGLPVDFVSCHPYPTDWALDEHGAGERLTRGVDATQTDLRAVRRAVDDSPFQNAEIHLTEWNSSSSPRDYTHDYPQAATYVVKANLESLGLVDSLAYWTFTDIFEENGGGQEPFHGGFGMINQHALRKPTFHAYRFLNSLGTRLVSQSNAGVITRAPDGRMSALFYHYPEEVGLTVPASFETRAAAEKTRSAGEPRPLDVTLSGLTPGSRVVVEVVGKSHADLVDLWKQRGAPVNLSIPDVAALNDATLHGELSEVVTGNDGVLRVSMLLNPWDIVSLRETADYSIDG